MDLPLLVSPSSLERLRDQLAVTARQLGLISAQVEQLGREDGWAGAAHRAFAAAALGAGSRCTDLSRRLLADSARVDRLAQDLAAELAVLHRLEHEVMGALGRLATRALDDATGTGRTLYAEVRRHLPGSGSPGWRGLAARLVEGELR